MKSIQILVNGKKHLIHVREDAHANKVHSYLVSSLSFLSSRGKLRGLKNSATKIMLAHVSESLREKHGKGEIIILKDDLSREEMIVSMAYEMLRVFYPEKSEEEVKEKTAGVLREIDNLYEQLVANGEFEEVSSGFLTKRDFFLASKKISSQAKNQIGLEKIIGTYFIIMGTLFIFNTFSGITGFAISSSYNVGLDALLSMSLIVIGLLLTLLNRIFKRN